MWPFCIKAPLIHSYAPPDIRQTDRFLSVHSSSRLLVPVHLNTNVPVTIRKQGNNERWKARSHRSIVSDMTMITTIISPTSPRKLENERRKTRDNRSSTPSLILQARDNTVVYTYSCVLRRWRPDVECVEFRRGTAANHATSAPPSSSSTSPFLLAGIDAPCQ